MAAIPTNRLLNARARSPAAGFFPTCRLMRGHSIVFERLKNIWSVTCEGLLLLWMLAVVAFALLTAAGALGFLG